MNPNDVILNDQNHDISMFVPFLTSIAKGYIFEIGLRSGISTAAFLLGLEQNGGGHVWSLDFGEEWGGIFRERDDWTFIHADSKDADLVKSKLPASLDILMIDGTHTYEHGKMDLENYSPLVKSGGHIILHDVCAPQFTLRKAFDEFVDKMGYKYEIFEQYPGLGHMWVP